MGSVKESDNVEMVLDFLCASFERCQVNKRSNHQDVKFLFLFLSLILLAAHGACPFTTYLRCAPCEFGANAECGVYRHYPND